MKRLVVLFIFFLTIQTFAQQMPKLLNLAIPQGEPSGVIVSFDGQYLALATSTENQCFLYEYVRQDERWVKPKLVVRGKYINSPAYNFNNTFLYFEADFGQGNTDIYYVVRQDTGWSLPESIGDKINTPNNERQPSIDPFNKRLFFVRDNPEEQGCGVIYYSINENGLWSKPVRLIIPGLYNCEIFPRVFHDGKTFIFAIHTDQSKSFDLYVTKNLTKGVWLVPKQLQIGDEKQNEYSATLDYQGKRLIFIQSSSKFKKPVLVYVSMTSEYRPDPVFRIYGKVKNENTNKPVPANIDILNPTTNSPIARYSTLKDGSYVFYLNPSENYIISYSAEGYSKYFYNLKARHISEFTEIQRDVKLFNTVTLQLNVFDSTIFEPLDVQISVRDLVSEQQLSIQPKILDKGRYLFTLPIGKIYEFTFSNEFYRTATLNFDLSGTVIYDNFEKDIELAPLLRKIVLKVIDAKNQKGVLTEVELVNLTTGKRIRTKVKTDENGNVVLFLRKGDVYEINITPKGYTFYHSVLDLEKEEVPQELTAEVEPLTTETKIEFHNITFETNSAELNEDSYEELNRLVELMKKNPNIKVEISAHTDDVGSEQYNMKLSLRRAQSVVNYLKEHGIPEDRMIARGYGETRPLVPNDSEEHRAMNRRVELRILEVNQNNQ